MVKEGYKETEIGVIPADWDISPLEPTIGKLKSGKRLPKGYLVTQNITTHPYIRVIDMKMGMLDTTNIMYVPDEAFPPISQYRIYKDDLYISVAGTLGLVGRIPEFLDGANLTENANRITDISCDVNYLLYWLMGSEIQKRISDSQTLGAQPKLALYQIRNFPIPTPRLEEQQKIAESLSDMDNLISSLEKLIEKKKDIKQGAMQELLSGKKRLTGFSGEWKNKNLLEIADFYDNLRVPVAESLRETGNTPYYGANGVQGYIKGFTHNGEFILVAEDGASDLKNYPVRYVSGKIWVNNHAHVLQGKDLIADTLFLSYLLSQYDFQSILVGGTRAKLNGSMIKTLNLMLPDMNEQKAIASILSDMDAEITALEQKLTKCQKLKQGMMQQLLTGKIRLISNDDVVTDKPEVDTLKVSSKGHNHQFDDAVVIAGIVDKFYSNKYPLGRKKVQKLLYLFRRHQEADTSAFKKKAAGPYADEVRYKGGEPIAVSNEYISVKKGSKGFSFSKGEKIASALTYLENWNLNDDLKWLCEQFKYIKTDRLELLATIDMAMCDLTDAGITVTVDSIKELIKSHSEWKEKLSKSYFKDNDIAWAIKECKRLFE